MNEKLQRFLENIIPFFMLGIAVALVVGLVIMFSYVLVWGILIGAILWVASFIKSYLFPNKSPTSPIEIKTKGRIIEHDKNED